MGSKRQNLLTGIAAACVVAALNLPAFAQQSAPIKQIPPQVLDQMSQDHPAQEFGTPPPASSIPPTQAYSIPGLWVCKSYDPKSGSLTLANRATAGGNWPNGNDKWENFGSPIG